MEFYQRNSLKDCFKALDTALLVPFKEPESRAGPRPPGRAWGGGLGRRGWRWDGRGGGMDGVRSPMVVGWDGWQWDGGGGLVVVVV